MLMVLIGAVLLLILQSCSQSGRYKSTIDKETEVTLRGRVLESGIIVPIKTTIEKNVYRVGDTVWVSRTTSNIINADWDKGFKTSSFILFVIEATNESKEEKLPTYSKQIEIPR